MFSRKATEFALSAKSSQSKSFSEAISIFKLKNLMFEYRCFTIWQAEASYKSVSKWVVSIVAQRLIPKEYCVFSYQRCLSANLCSGEVKRRNTSSEEDSSDESLAGFLPLVVLVTRSEARFREILSPGTKQSLNNFWNLKVKE